MLPNEVVVAGKSLEPAPVTSEKRVGLDNPHTSERELGYLAAMIDGEGTITLERTGKRRICGVMGLAPKIIVANTNPAIVTYVMDIFKRLGVNPHVKSSIVGRNKQCFWVTVQGLAKTKRILQYVEPYLVGKVAQAKLMLEFIILRGDPRLAKGKVYGSQEIEILDKIRALNRRGVTETEDHERRVAIAASLNDSPQVEETQLVM